MGRNLADHLPYYDSETKVLFGSTELTEAQHHPDEYLMRAVLVETPQKMGRNLLRILEHTDEQLEQIATMCGALLIEHEWGIFDASNEPPQDVKYYQGNRPRSLGLRDQHIVVAKVPTIRNVKRVKQTNPEFFVLNQGIHSYRLANKDGGLSDITPLQFVHGDLPKSEYSGLILVDIDSVWKF